MHEHNDQPQQDGVPWWRNHPWLGKHLWYENRNKNAHLLLSTTTCMWPGIPMAPAFAMQTEIFRLSPNVSRTRAKTSRGTPTSTPPTNPAFKEDHDGLAVSLSLGAAVARERAVSYFGATGFRRPLLDIFLIGPAGVPIALQVQVDCASDYTALDATVSGSLGLTLPAARQIQFTGATVTQFGSLSFPPDGEVSLFVTDYTGYCYLPAPLIGFHPPAPQRRRSVLGLAGFLQYFELNLRQGARPPMFELRPEPGFPGSMGTLPKTGDVRDFIRTLRRST